MEQQQQAGIASSQKQCAGTLGRGLADLRADLPAGERRCPTAPVFETKCPRNRLAVHETGLLRAGIEVETMIAPKVTLLFNVSSPTLVSGAAKEACCL